MLRTGRNCPYAVQFNSCPTGPVLIPNEQSSFVVCSLARSIRMWLICSKVWKKENTYKNNPRKQDVPEESITDVVSATCGQHFQTVFNNRLPSLSISGSCKLFWTYSVRKCNAVKLAVPQASVFNWTPYTNIRSQMCVVHICDLIFVLDFYLAILPHPVKEYQNIPCFLTHKVF